MTPSSSQEGIESGPVDRRRLDAKARAALLASTDRVDVRIEKLIEGGDGFARFRGIPFFVPRAAPGDRLRVRVTDRRPDYARAEIESILEPGPQRRAAPCEYFERCGGCDLQHIEDAAQLEMKVAAATETLRRLGGIEEGRLAEIVRVRRSANPWGYRMRAQLQVEGNGESLRLGFYERKSHQLIDVEHCAVLQPELERFLTRARRALAQVEKPPRRLDVACAQGRVSCAPPVAGLPSGAIEAAVGEHVYELDARCFFQGHGELTQALVSEVVEAGGSGLALDLYCGVGLFTMPLAAGYDRVVGVESERIAARYARRNARRNRRDNVEILNLSVERALARRGLSGVSRVVVDPPRSGLSGVVRSALSAEPVPHLTYVSCRPATLARDLRELARSYSIESITFFDFFAQTGHLETVVQLRTSTRCRP